MQKEQAEIPEKSKRQKKESMASFKITGQMKVKTLKEQFMNNFGSVLRVYYHHHFAPHPGNVVKNYAMKQVYEDLKEAGYLK